MKDNLILEKSMAFAIRIVNTYQYLSIEKKEYTMSRQLLRCGTSIGANIHEGVNGQTRKDFLSKMYISFKEASETEYWIILLTRTGYLNETRSEDILSECVEIKRILNAIIKTTKQKDKPQ